MPSVRFLITIPYVHCGHQLVLLDSLIPGWLPEEDVLWAKTLQAATSLPRGGVPVTIDFR